MWYFDTSRHNNFVSKVFASGLQACLGLAHASKKFKNEKKGTSKCYYLVLSIFTICPLIPTNRAADRSKKPFQKWFKVPELLFVSLELLI